MFLICPVTHQKGEGQNTHLDLLLDVSESVGGAHVGVLWDAHHVQLHLHLQLHLGVRAHHLLHLLGGDHDNLCRHNPKPAHLRSHARRQPARQEQLGLGVLLRDTSTLY